MSTLALVGMAAWIFAGAPAPEGEPPSAANRCASRCYEDNQVEGNKCQARCSRKHKRSKSKPDPCGLTCDDFLQRDLSRCLDKCKSG